MSTSSGSSGSSSVVAVPPTFYFPSSRTRAHPKSPTQFALGKATKPKFFKLGLKNKKATMPSVSGPVPWVPPPERQPSPLQRTLLMQPVDEEQYAMQAEDPRGSYDDDGLDMDSTYRDSMLAEPPSPQIVTKVGTYPLDAYDAGLIDGDLQTWELLRKINATNTPSFHNYGGRPPRHVLDLGCGAGHWMLDAAMAWRNSGTQIVGFDMVDTTKGMWPAAQRQGIANNLQFVRGNFIKQPLPFPDGSFQLVRMASLALCIPHESWEFVLDQVWRVLAVGGRLEFIDDHIFFPYGKPPVLTPRSQMSSPVPTLDTMIPSTVFSRMSLNDVVNPSVRDDTDSQIYDLYGVEEEDEASDTDTVASAQADPEGWHEQAASARELEALFEHMMNVKYGIHLRPSDFVGDMLMRVFGGVKEMSSLHLTLAPPEQGDGAGGIPNQRPASIGSRPRTGRFERAQVAATAGVNPDDALGHCPGLILWPSTFIPMPLPELEAHVTRHMRVLLSCKGSLIDYAAEIADQGEGETQSEAAMETLWEYQNFLRERFNPPPEDHSRAMSDASSSVGDASSIFSVSSVGTEALDAMREYQTELTGRFEVPSEPPKPVRKPVQESATPTRGPTPPPQRANAGESSGQAAAGSSTAPDRPRKSRSRGSRGKDRSSVVSSIVPPYSRIELTHVRTFYVYEAVKQAQDRFQIGRPGMI
ncbi:hypothetical protein R3P38DRAFT_2522078 [Favolaschia claudopus]|uniref:Methyltransferase domain-containing protein n=1 Tax=Favolaschia claudopus TaxID=2862362 RepID=A0AAW0BXK9_9AGAR